MDFKMTKTRLGVHFEYDWVKYILIVLAAIVLWVSVYSVANNPTVSQRVDIVTYFTPTFSSEMENKLSGDRMRIFGEDTDVKKLELIAFKDEKNNSLIETYLASSDMMIGAIENFTDTLIVAQDYFLPFDDVLDAGYWADEDGREMFRYLEEHDAFYRYEISEKVLAQYESEAQREEIRALMQPYVGKIVGIVLNRIPRMDKGCFFAYDTVSTDSEGNAIDPYTQEYVLAINNLIVDDRHSGGNRGVFNAEKEDKSRTETFDFLSYLFRGDPSNPGLKNVERYTVV